MVCQKTVTLEITGGIQAYWTLQEVVPADNTDSVSGDLLDASGLGASAGVPCVIGNGLEIAGGFGNMRQSGEQMQYGGAGFSVCFWLKMTDAGPLVVYNWDSINTTQFYMEYQSVLFQCVMHLMIAGADVETINLGAGNFDNTFHFFCVTYDPAGGKLRASKDGAVFTVGAASNLVPATTDSAAFMAVFSTTGPNSVFYDEVALFPYPLSEAQKDYLWNAGIGRTYPIVFPP